jgi:hypothetical protein
MIDTTVSMYSPYTTSLHLTALPETTVLSNNTTMATVITQHKSTLDTATTSLQTFVQRRNWKFFTKFSDLVKSFYREVLDADGYLTIKGAVFVLAVALLLSGIFVCCVAGEREILDDMKTSGPLVFTLALSAMITVLTLVLVILYLADVIGKIVLYFVGKRSDTNKQ